MKIKRLFVVILVLALASSVSCSSFKNFGKDVGNKTKKVGRSIKDAVK